MCFIVYKSHVLHKKRTPADILTPDKRKSPTLVDASAPSRRYTAANFHCLIAKMGQLPVLWDDPDLSLLVTRFQFHVAPIFLRCAFTRAARDSTSLVSFGRGVA